MAIDPKKRQQKLERHKAKRKAEKRVLARRDSQGLPGRMERAAAAPILHCCAASTLWIDGIGQVLFSRQLPSGDVAFANFLVDMYCLGVKNVIVEIAPRVRYDANMYRKVKQQYDMQDMKPEAARKLVEGAVEYARDLGLPPHPEYRIAKLLFGSVLAEACDEEFVYGKNGKPYFIQGPYDDAERCEEIFRALSRHEPRTTADDDAESFGFVRVLGRFPGSEFGPGSMVLSTHYRVLSGPTTAKIGNTMPIFPAGLRITYKDHRPSPWGKSSSGKLAGCQGRS